MSKYVTVPDDAVILDPVEDTPTGDKVSFAKTVRVVCAIASQAGVDALTLIDVRRKLSEAAPGQIVELSDEEYAAVAPHFKNPRGATPALIFSAEAHLRAVVDATSKRPAVLAGP